MFVSTSKMVEYAKANLDLFQNFKVHVLYLVTVFKETFLLFGESQVLQSFVIRNTKQIFDGGIPVLMYETALTKMFFVTNSLCISTSIFYEHTKICINFYLTQFLMCKYLHLLSFTNTCELVWITITLVHNIFIFFFVIYIYFQTAFNSICIQQIAYHFINM